MFKKLRLAVICYTPSSGRSKIYYCRCVGLHVRIICLITNTAFTLTFLFRSWRECCNSVVTVLLELKQKHTCHILFSTDADADADGQTTYEIGKMTPNTTSSLARTNIVCAPISYFRWMFWGTFNTKHYISIRFHRISFVYFTF